MTSYNLLMNSRFIAQSALFLHDLFFLPVKLVTDFCIPFITTESEFFAYLAGGIQTLVHAT